MNQKLQKNGKFFKFLELLLKFRSILGYAHDQKTCCHSAENSQSSEILYLQLILYQTAQFRSTTPDEAGTAIRNLWELYYGKSQHA